MWLFFSLFRPYLLFAIEQEGEAENGMEKVRQGKRKIENCKEIENKD